MVIFIERKFGYEKKFFDSLRQPLLMADSVGDYGYAGLGGGVYRH
jgi:hypothetical protein